MIKNSNLYCANPKDPANSQRRRPIVQITSVLQLPPIIVLMLSDRIYEGWFSTQLPGRTIRVGLLFSYLDLAYTDGNFSLDWFMVQLGRLGVFYDLIPLHCI